MEIVPTLLVRTSQALKSRLCSYTHQFDILFSDPITCDLGFGVKGIIDLEKLAQDDDYSSALRPY